MIAIEREYEQARAARQRAWAADERRHRQFGYVRLICVIGAIAVLVMKGLAGMAWVAVPVGALLLATVAHGRVLAARERAAAAIAFYDRGLARVRDAWIGTGRTGDEWRPAEHSYADDLDLFGRGSLFELLATSRTRSADETLARWLLTPAPPETIAARQAAVTELAARSDLREAVAVVGDRVRSSVHPDVLRGWATVPPRLVAHAAVRVALGLVTLAMLTSLVWWVRTGQHGWAFGVALAVQCGIAQLYKARVGAVIHAVDGPSHDLDLLAELLAILERERFVSPHLERLRTGMSSTARPASREIARLSQLVALLSSRNNLMFAIPAALLMWATQCGFAIERWRARVGHHVPAWLETIGEFEALLALGAFAAEHPTFVIPTIAAGPPSLEARDLAHPTLGATAVANDITIGVGDVRLFVVSGSNMSGKSTWLRTIGLNVVLAQMGAPVRATAFRATPLAIGAAIRVQDSLTEGRSRFFAEISRLKMVVDLTRRENGAVIFLLDEILSGTNSHDRRIGAEALLLGLVAAGAIGLVTTHDLALAAIADRLGTQAVNVHFEDRFEGAALVFDYRVKPGLVRTSNALALMRSIGLEV